MKCKHYKIDQFDNIWCDCDGEPLSSHAVLGEGFDIDTAIKNTGNCRNQKVDCSKCKMGKYIFDNNLKFREDELCKHEIVFLLAKVVKTFA